MKKGIKIYVWLLAANLFISAFTFGGGYIVVPMVHRFFVAKKQYFTEEDLINMAAIAQSTPGAIAINLSALAGYKVAGMTGAFISCFAAVIPPLIILTGVSAFYKIFVANTVIAAILKGMEAGVGRFDGRFNHGYVFFNLKEKIAFSVRHDPFGIYCKLHNRYQCGFDIVFLLFFMYLTSFL